MKNDFEPAFVDPANFDPHAPAFIANPYASYKWFRENEPIFGLKKTIRVTGYSGMRM